MEPTKFGNYYLIERVNIGGMAEVFKAVSYGVEGFERQFAVKRVLPNISEDLEFIEMFIDEAKIAVQLNHANIGQIFELGQVGNAYFIAMEFVQGKDLRAIFDRARKLGRTLDPAMACHVIKDVCEALEYAHNKKDEHQNSLNLVHRDVSPQNIIVSYDGEVKLIDFGIAKAAGKASRTQAGILKGKFGYMSPEHVRGKPIDRRSDLFALAVVLFELLTLERCFQGESDFSTLEKVRNVDIRRPSSINRNIPPELERILVRGLSRSPDERYQSAAELQDALQKFLYQSGSFYARKDLAAFMDQTFREDVEEEQRKLAEFRQHARRNIPEARPDSAQSVLSNGRGPAGNSSFQPLPDLVWDDDELDTTVWEPDANTSGPKVMGGGPPGLSPFGGSAEEQFGPGPLNASRVAVPSSQALDLSMPRDPPNHAPLYPTLARPKTSSWRVFVLVGTLLLAAAGAIYGIWEYIGIGSITVESDPSEVTIHIDGRLVHEGSTPRKIEQIRPGLHRVLITADGYQPVSKELSLERNVDFEIRVRLKKLDPHGSTGFHITTDPAGATVRVDGELLNDSTPTIQTGIEPGPRSLHLSRSGYQPMELDVVAVEDQIVEVKTAAGGPLTLKPFRVHLTVISEPNGAKISLYALKDGNQKLIGTQTAQCVFEDLDNSHGLKLVAELPGYETATLEREPCNDVRPHEIVELIKSQRRAPRKTKPSGGKPRRRSDCPGEDCPDRAPSSASGVGPDTSATGYLSVQAHPSAAVYVDGGFIQWTPLVKKKLPVGPHEVKLVRGEDRTPHYSKTMRVQIKPEDVNILRYTHKE